MDTILYHTVADKYEAGKENTRREVWPLYPARSSYQPLLVTPSSRHPRLSHQQHGGATRVHGVVVTASISPIGLETRGTKLHRAVIIPTLTVPRDLIELESKDPCTSGRALSRQLPRQASGLPTSLELNLSVTSTSSGSSC